MFFRTILAAGFCAILTTSVFAAETAYPLVLKNCGSEITFSAAPKRAVAVGQSSTEILYLLGLADHVVGTAVWMSPVLAGFEQVNAKVPRLADNDPSFESIVATRPDLVATQFQWQIGPQGAVATPQQFSELKIPVYTSPADCTGKDNTTGGDGLRTDRFAMDLVYQEIDDLARIFNVQERGAELIARLKAREAAAREKLTALHGKASALFWFSSAELKSDPFVAGQKGAPGYMMALLGVDNIIASDEEWPTVGWETIARADPSVIVLAKMDRRRYPADDVTVKRDFLNHDPVTRLMTAVREKRLIEMDAQAMNPTIRTIDGLEALADGLAKAGLKP